jgi:hypothetical protein
VPMRRKEFHVYGKRSLFFGSDKSGYSSGGIKNLTGITKNDSSRHY